MPAGASVESPGTTSAHAENTCGEGASRCRWWNYLRARGEYKNHGMGPSLYMELPPRTRRIHAPAGVNNLVDGTTSAHAENTPKWLPVRALAGNYLRARGEYFQISISGIMTLELPPRTRRIPHGSTPACVYVRTTSAHAENTGTHRHGRTPNGNYLRARGEYPPSPSAASATWELPPRTRRIHQQLPAQ